MSNERVAVLGTAMSDMSRRDLSPEQMSSQVIADVLDGAGVPSSELSCVLVANACGWRLSDQGCIRGQSWLRKASLGDAPIVNVDNSCAGGVSALHLGLLAARAQDRPVLVLGVEKMWTGDRQATLEAIEAGLPSDYRSDMRDRLSDNPDQAGSILMAVNAAWAARFIEERGGTLEQFAAVSVKARTNGALNPLAQCQRLVTAEEVLGSPRIAGVLTRLMCSSFTDGAAAILLSSSPRASTRPVAEVLGALARSGRGDLDYHDRLADAAKEAYESFGLGPSDFDLVELHDATSPEELFCLESIGMFEPGAAGPATLAGETAIGGRSITVNPSGGLLARGHPLGATGLTQIVEVVEQLRGRAGRRQVQGARLGLCVNTGGIIHGDAGYVGLTAIGKVS